MLSDEFVSGLTGILSAVSAGFSILQGFAGYQSGRQNAAYAKAEGDQAMVTADAEAKRQRQLIASQQATLRAEAGAQGTDFSGSPMEVYLANAKAGEIEAQDKLYAGKLQQRSKKIEADIYKRGATSSLFSGFAGAASSLGSGLIGKR